MLPLRWPNLARVFRLCKRVGANYSLTHCRDTRDSGFLYVIRFSKLLPGARLVTIGIGPH